MIRRRHILTAAALLAVCATPAAGAAGEYRDLRSPDAVDAAEHRGLYETDKGPYLLNRDYGSPDAVDTARDLPRVVVTPRVVEVRETPSGGFDWGDAGIGAAGVLGLFSIAAGSALLVTGRRRRGTLRAATR
jgi:hypothetical protein